jgi:hypothetical protein
MQFSRREKVMKTIEELQVELIAAEFEVSRALALIDTHAQQRSYGVVIDRNHIFQDNLRLRCAEHNVSKITGHIKSRQCNQAPVGPMTQDQHLEIKRIKLEVLRLKDCTEREKTNRHKISMDLNLQKQYRIVEKLREIVGEEAYAKICAELSAK